MKRWIPWIVAAPMGILLHGLINLAIFAVLSLLENAGMESLSESLAWISFIFFSHLGYWFITLPVLVVACFFVTRSIVERSNVVIADGKL